MRPLLLAVSVIALTLMGILVWWLIVRGHCSYGTSDTFTQDDASPTFSGPQSGRIPGSTPIPKVIRQIVRDKNNINPEIRKVMTKLRNDNPGWKYELYDVIDCQKYLKRYHPGRIEHAYDSINPDYGAGKSDLFRYVLMYDKGGAYFDDKSCAVKPLDQIIRPDDEYILTHWPTRDWHEIIGNERGEFQQWHIICRPQHPFLAAAIERVLNNIENYNMDRDGVGQKLLAVTGPIAYSLAIYPLTKTHYHRVAVDSEDIGLVFNGSLGGAHTHRSYSGRTHYSALTTPIIQDSYGENDFSDVHSAADHDAGAIAALDSLTSSVGEN